MCALIILVVFLAGCRCCLRWLAAPDFVFGSRRRVWRLVISGEWRSVTARHGRVHGCEPVCQTRMNLDPGRECNVRCDGMCVVRRSRCKHHR